LEQEVDKAVEGANRNGDDASNTADTVGGLCYATAPVSRV
jgi:hypothetical protein